MKKDLTHIMTIILAFITFSGGCKKDDMVYEKDFASFVFTADKNPGLTADIAGKIEGDTILVDVPNAADITQMVASFERINPRTIVQVDGKVQESGITSQDYSKGEIKYQIKAEDKSVRQYIIKLRRRSAFLSFGFYKEDNAGFLLRDFVGTARGLNLVVAVSRDIDLSQLAARFEVSEGCVVKVAGVEQQSRVSKNDFSSSLESSENKLVYEVSEPGSTESQRYSVTITYIKEYEWQLIGSNVTGSGAAGIKMAINPVTNLPAIAYQRTGTDENGASIATNDKKCAVAALTASGWQFLGEQKGVSEFRADNIAIAYDKAGNTYVAYKDYMGGEQKVTVIKYTGTWSVVGSSRFTLFKPSYLSIALDDSNIPYISMTKDGATPEPGIANRAVVVMSFKNGQWSYDSTPGILAFYTQLIKANGKLYLGVMDRSTNTNRPSVFVLNGSAWNIVGTSSFGANATAGYQMVSPAVAPDGTTYAAYQESVSGKRVDHVMKLEGGVWKEVGQGVPVLGTSDNFALSVHPDGTLFFAWVQPQVESTAAGLYVKTFNKDLNSWNKARLVISGTVNNFDMQISADGVPYLAGQNSEGKTVVYKYALK
ncbi:hypothetical protein [Arcticibacter tournemirensis]